jgi:hypothetical protein
MNYTVNILLEEMLLLDPLPYQKPLEETKKHQIKISFYFVGKFLLSEPLIEFDL